MELGDLASFEYGFLYESVSYVNRLNFVSPYGRLTYHLGKDRELHLRYASGVPRPDEALGDNSSSLREQVSTLGMFPRMSLRNGRPTVQRTEHMEISYSERMGDGLLEAGVYKDSLSDAAVSAFVPGGQFADGNVLPDLFSRSSTLNGGRHNTTGYRVSYARKIRDRLEAALGYGSSGVLTTERPALETPDVAELRDIAAHEPGPPDNGFALDRAAQEPHARVVELSVGQPPGGDRARPLQRFFGALRARLESRDPAASAVFGLAARQAGGDRRYP